MKIGLPLQSAEDQTRTTMMKWITHLLEVATLVCEVVIAEEDVKQMKKSVVRKRISKLRAQRLIILIGDDSISTNCHARHKNMGHWKTVNIYPFFINIRKFHIFCLRCVSRNRCSPPRRRQEDLDASNSVRSGGNNCGNIWIHITLHNWKKLIYDKSYIENLSSSPALCFTDVPIFGEDYHCNVDEQKQTSSDSKTAINVGQRSGNI